eukprot:CAMPEP_0177652516 /NCGR_PEP_ID=MMETSP0447-20121125/13179_1 /TAXON_ID=0 /ORGANISM="Stygamoeba regulata, Strain BSH-02190019" /LENGTH=144 /DNA_ID=CAMNT_0019155781 /DNA_START=47 /DNA_END=478 /DNA_ORIENTATION=+
MAQPAGGPLRQLFKRITSFLSPFESNKSAFPDFKYRPGITLKSDYYVSENFPHKTESLAGDFRYYPRDPDTVLRRAKAFEGSTPPPPPPPPPGAPAAAAPPPPPQPKVAVNVCSDLEKSTDAPDVWLHGTEWKRQPRELSPNEW